MKSFVSKISLVVGLISLTCNPVFCSENTKIIWREDFGTFLTDSTYWEWDYSDLNNPKKVAYHYEDANYGWVHPAKDSTMVNATYNSGAEMEGTYCIAGNVTCMWDAPSGGTQWSWTAYFNGSRPGQIGWDFVYDHTYNGSDYGGMLYVNVGTEAGSAIYTNTVKNLPSGDYKANCFINNFSDGNSPVAIFIRITDLSTGSTFVSNVVKRYAIEGSYDWGEVETNFTIKDTTDIKIEVVSAVGGTSYNAQGNDLIIDDITIYKDVTNEPDSVHIVILSEDTAKGTVSGQTDYAVGDSLLVYATPIGKNTFAGWKSLKGLGTEIASENDTLVALFNAPKEDSLVKNERSLTLVPLGNGYINNKSTHTIKYTIGDTITLRAKGLNGDVFNGWCSNLDKDNLIEEDSLVYYVTEESVIPDTIYAKFTAIENTKIIWREDFGTFLTDSTYWEWDYSDLNNPKKVAYDYKDANYGWVHPAKDSTMVNATYNSGAEMEGTYCIAGNVTCTWDAPSGGTQWSWTAYFNGSRPGQIGWDFVYDHTYNGSDYGGMLYVNVGTEAGSAIYTNTVKNLPSGDYKANCFINNFSEGNSPVAIFIRITDLSTDSTFTSYVVQRYARGGSYDWGEVETNFTIKDTTDIKIEVVSAVGGKECNDQGNDLIIDDITIYKDATNDTTESVTQVSTVANTDGDDVVNVYTIEGRLVRANVKRSEIMPELKKGFYIVGHDKVRVMR